MWCKASISDLNRSYQAPKETWVQGVFKGQFTSEYNCMHFCNLSVVSSLVNCFDKSDWLIKHSVMQVQSERAAIRNGFNYRCVCRFSNHSNHSPKYVLHHLAAKKEKQHLFSKCKKQWFNYQIILLQCPVDGTPMTVVGTSMTRPPWFLGVTPAAMQRNSDCPLFQQFCFRQDICSIDIS